MWKKKKCIENSQETPRQPIDSNKIPQKRVFFPPQHFTPVQHFDHNIIAVDQLISCGGGNIDFFNSNENYGITYSTRIQMKKKRTKCV